MDLFALYEDGINLASLGWFCGRDRHPGRNRQDANSQAMKLFEHCKVVPSRAHQNPPCPVCNRNPPVLMTTVTDNARDGWRFCCPHGHKRSRFSGTFLERARLNDIGGSRILKIICCWLQDLTQVVCNQTVHCSSDTINAWYGYCRDVARKIAWHDFTPIGGDHDIVEIDETHLFKRKYRVGKLTEWKHNWLFGGISRTTQQRFGVLVPSRDSDTLLPLLQQFVDCDSVIFSNEFPAYRDVVGQAFAGHLTVNHCENFVIPPEDEDPFWAPADTFHPRCLQTFIGPRPQGMEEAFCVSTNKFERSWRDLEKTLGTLNNFELADGYIGEWMYRHNILNKLSDDLTAQYDRFLRDVARAYPGLRGKKMQPDILKCDCHECEP